MTLREIKVTHETRAFQDAFIDFVPRIFAGIGFGRWRDLGGWDDRYVAFSVMEGDRLVASASRMQMEVVLRGTRRRAWQLTAVGTLPEWRKRGLQEQIMKRLIDDTPGDDLMFLFGNENVVDFYPRFGFERAQEWKFQAPWVAESVEPPLRVMDVTRAADRELLLRIAHAARPATEEFGVRDHGTILLWYCCNYMPNVLRHVPEHDAIIAVEQSGELLHVYDVLSAAPFDVPRFLRRTLSGPVARVEFGFTPERIWPEAAPAYEYTEGPLFVRGGLRLPDKPFKYPMLGQT